jgi:hypothetical protein
MMIRVEKRGQKFLFSHLREGSSMPRNEVRKIVGVIFKIITRFSLVMIVRFLLGHMCRYMHLCKILATLEGEAHATLLNSKFNNENMNHILLRSMLKLLLIVMHPRIYTKFWWQYE